MEKSYVTTSLRTIVIGIKKINKKRESPSNPTPIYVGHGIRGCNKYVQKAKPSEGWLSEVGILSPLRSRNSVKNNVFPARSGIGWGPVRPINFSVFYGRTILIIFELLLVRAKTPKLTTTTTIILPRV